MELIQKLISGAILFIFLAFSSKLQKLIPPSPVPEDSTRLVFKEDSVKKPRITRFLQYYAPGDKVADSFKTGDTFYKALSRHNIEQNLINEFTRLSFSFIDLTRIQTGTPFEIYFDESRELVEFRLRIAWDKQLIIKKDKSSRWTAKIQKIKVATSIQCASGTISTSLWNAATEKGIAPSTIVDFADLLSWQIDFATDFKSGDQFQILYEKNELPDGESIPGAILAAKVVNNGKTYFAFQYHYADGKSEYYDFNGNAVKCMFLKSPLRYRYISSYFSYKRFHPILKVVRPHLGIDFAAPSGTPVSALGDGIIIFKGVRGGFGNYVEIQHANEYVTCYGHLSRFANGIKKGSRVEQGSVIGYVGATGTATGPHLDFRVRVRGNYLNPLSLKSSSAGPLPEDCRASFIEQRDRLVAKLAGETD